MVVSETDSVSLLQEYYAKKGIIPKYEPVAPEDFRRSVISAFKCRVTVGDISAIGSGPNKKDAKHKAARELLDKLDPTEVAKFLKPPKNVVNRHPDGLKGREIGMFYAQMSKQKKAQKVAQNRDFIDISREQLKEVEKISRLLDENAHDVQDDSFFGRIDYQSEFMKAYHFNLDENAASAKMQTEAEAESEEVESWEMLEEAQPDPIEETTQNPSKGNTISIFDF